MIKTESEAWKYINRYGGRKQRERIDKSNEMKKWKSHFMELLEGHKDKQESRIKQEHNEEEKEMESERITKEEVIKQLLKLKREKAPGCDEIQNEEWRLMPMEVGEVFLKLLNKIWMVSRIPRDGRNGIICPIFKKEEKDKAKNYREITLLVTAYKVYTSILNDRVKKDIKGKLADGQFGFRAGRGAIDAIYILNYIVNKELRKEGWLPVS